MLWLGQNFCRPRLHQGGTGRRTQLSRLGMGGTRRRLSYQPASQFASCSRAADTAGSAVVSCLRLKRIDADKEMDAVILQVIAVRNETPIKSVAPIKLGVDMSIGVEN